MIPRTDAIRILVLATVLGVAGQAPAQQPQLITHVMLLWGPVSLEWDQQESLALVVLPDDPAEDRDVREVTIIDTDVITNTLTAKFPDLAEEDIAYLAELLLAAFEPQGEENVLRASFVTAPVAHVTTGGAEFLCGDSNPVFWDGSPPPSGATAQAGQRGGVMVLGEFFVRRKPEGPLSTNTYILVEQSESAIPVQIALGLFTE
jgi:hypothetical protein